MTDKELDAAVALIHAAIRWTDNRSDKAPPKMFDRIVEELRAFRSAPPAPTPIEITKLADPRRSYLCGVCGSVYQGAPIPTVMEEP